jgi:hypothetical protein
LYYCDIQLGLKLLKAGIKYLSIDELVFGKNYLSPSIYIALASSLLHFFLNVLQEENNNIFKLIAFIGSLCRVLVLLKGRAFVKIVNQLKTQVEVLVCGEHN